MRLHGFLILAAGVALGAVPTAAAFLARDLWLPSRDPSRPEGAPRARPRAEPTQVKITPQARANLAIGPSPPFGQAAKGPMLFYLPIAEVIVGQRLNRTPGFAAHRRSPAVIVGGERE
jgi:hypothetical protein